MENFKPKYGRKLITVIFPKDSFRCLVYIRISDPRYISNNSSIFGTGLEGTIAVKDRSAIFLLGNELTTRSPDDAEETLALRKSIQIKSQFFSPLRQVSSHNTSELFLKY